MMSALNAPVLGHFTGWRPPVSTLRLGQLITLAVAALLTGCSSLNIGNSDYACPGMPDGIQCMSTLEVYAMTNDGNVPRPMNKDEKDYERKKNEESLQHIGSTDTQQDFINTYVAPQLPDRPVPIRTPAQVMRIWVAPWEDTNGDLITTGYVHTEIEPRRWVVAEQAPKSDPVLRPLQVTR
ncbi:type IV conjugative transfer system lipoprotein TraV (plasmid) [Alcaligenes faecalis]|nr:type IV conjugative transfer system lipoprotein TraV [Alcaligenes faecalis]QHS38455.1 type IV conjugative transfer system lipoprotein TraV [Alcaligenes faecalis]